MLADVSGRGRVAQNLLGAHVGRDLSGHSRGQSGQHTGLEEHVERAGHRLKKVERVWSRELRGDDGRTDT